MQLTHKILRFASLFKSATRAETHKWAANVVNQAFQRVMGRMPSPAERQIVMAVSDLESNYGKGWKQGKGAGSHNWGAIQTRSKTAPSFFHQDSSAEGKYITRFKAYPDDVAGAADVVSSLFKNNRKQQKPNPEKGYRTLGGEIPGPTRGQLIEDAAKQGDTLAFSKAMWYTTYFEGFGKDFTDRIKKHAQGIQNRINSIASALGESPAWSIKSNNYLPVTNDQSILNEIAGMSNNIQSANTPPVNYIQNQLQNTPFAQSVQQPEQQQDIDSIENVLWFN